MTEQITRRWTRALASSACAAVLALCALPAAAQYTLSEGTQINAVLASGDIDTKSAQIGDAFTMNVVPPYPNGDANFAGAVLRGHVREVTKASQGKAAGLKLAFDSIVFPNGESAPMSGTVTSATAAKAENTNGRKGLAAAIGAAIGSQTIGRIIGGSAGSVIGLLGGAAGGFLYANNDKPNLDLANGTAVSVQTSADVEIPRRQATQ